MFIFLMAGRKTTVLNSPITGSPLNVLHGLICISCPSHVASLVISSKLKEVVVLSFFVIVRHEVSGSVFNFT